MKTKFTEKQLLIRIRLLVLFFMGALIISGLTAFAIETELLFISPLLGIEFTGNSDHYNQLQVWIYKVYNGISTTNKNFSFISYGTDWLAFAHIIIAFLFWGVYFKPVRNIWLIYWGMLACILVIPLALLCGLIREIPLFWILIDCSFGILGIIPLFLLRRYINDLARISGCYVPTKY